MFFQQVFIFIAVASIFQIIVPNEGYSRQLRELRSVEKLPSDSTTMSSDTDNVSLSDSETTSLDQDNVVPQSSGTVSPVTDNHLPRDSKTESGDKENNVLSQHSESMSSGKYSSFAQAVFEILNGIHYQRGNSSDIDDSYVVAVYKYLLPFIKKVNISQEEYIVKINSYFGDSGPLHVYALPCVARDSENINVRTINNYAITNLTFKTLDSVVLYESVTIIDVEIRMLMEHLPMRPLSTLQVNDWMEYTLFVEDPDTDMLISRHVVWLPTHGSKWISIRSRSLTNLVKNFYDILAHRVYLTKWKLRISGLPIYPERAYLNVIVNHYEKHCKKIVFNENRHLTNVVKNRLYTDEYPWTPSISGLAIGLIRASLNAVENHYLEKELKQCYNRTGYYGTFAEPAYIDSGCSTCCKNIPFDSEEINVPILNIKPLTEHFYAPVEFKYKYCLTQNSTATRCIPDLYEYKSVLTPDWNDPESLIETDISQFTDVRCK